MHTNRPLLQNSREVYGGEGGLAITTADSAAIDAFARQRVSTPAGLFDSQLQYNTANLFWYQSPATGSFVTHLPNESSVNLTVASGQTTIRQTKQYHRYQPGKSQQILMTFVCQQPTLGLYQNVGYFDAQNGIFFHVSENDNSLNFVLRSYVSGSPVDTTVSQADWNVDTMTGAGGDANPSGIRLDITQSQILIMDLEWLGVGRVRVGFVIDGIPVYCHDFLNANKNDSVYMTTANLPLRYEISAAGGMTGTYSLKQICCAVTSEGGVELERGLPVAVDTRASGTLSVTSEVAVLAIRPKATFNGIVNRGRIEIEGYNTEIATNGAWVSMVYNPTLPTGTAWASANSESIVEYAILPGAFTGGIRNESEPIPASGLNANSRVGSGEADIISKLPITLDINGANPIPIAITAQSKTGTAGVFASIRWREVK